MYVGAFAFSRDPFPSIPEMSLGSILIKQVEFSTCGYRNVLLSLLEPEFLRSMPACPDIFLRVVFCLILQGSFYMICIL